MVFILNFNYFLKSDSCELLKEENGSASNLETTHNILELIIQAKHYGPFTFLPLNI